MRSAHHRKEKYRKKLRALVLPGQTSRYAPTAADRIRLEYCVKREAITPMLQFSYVAFCEELIKHDAGKRPEEAEGIYNKWLNRGLDGLTMYAVADCIGITTPSPCPWSWKRSLTFTGNVSATDLDDFPVLVHLTNANFNFNKAQDNGEDIRFMDSDTCPTDGTPLKHEIEHWDKAGANAWVWVKVPRISVGVADFIYMFYGNAAAPDGQDAANVWTDNFRAVWHLRGGAGTSLPDSAGDARDGTKNAIGSPSNVTDNIDGSQEFDGLNDWVDVAGWTFNGESITMEAWVYDASHALGYIICRQNPIGDSNGDMDFRVDDGAGHIRFELREAGAVKNTLTSTTAPAGSWFHVIATWNKDTNGGKARIYINGVEAAYTTQDAWVNIITSQNQPIRMGARTGAGANYKISARMDEIRIHSAYRTGDYILGQYKSMAETLITYGAEEAA